ncbi:MAG: c-type cytochrome [Archangiaceae bacterium]|nr:c-type cytochrome [Archangiaceae bacterium]
MKKGLMVGAVATALTMVGCTNSPSAKSSSASGSLALSSDDGLLYAADTDNGVVSVIDTKTDEKLYDVKVGTRPMRVAVGTDDTLYVANRGSRSVSVIRKGERQVTSEVATGADPTGLAVSFDGKTLYVVSATAKDTSDYGILQAVDTETLQVKYESNVGYEPRSIALISNDKALLTEYRGQDKGANVVEVDLKTGAVMTDTSNNKIYDQLNKTKVSGDTSGNTYASFKARAMSDVVVTPDGKRAFVPAVLAREDDITRMPSSTGGYYQQGGPCNVGAVATEGIVTLDTSETSESQARTDDLTDCASRGVVDSSADFPPTAVGSGSISTLGGGTGASASAVKAVQGPTAAAVDPSGNWLFVVNRETSNLAVIPAYRREGYDGENIDFGKTGQSLRSVSATAGNADPALNTGSDGIAITRDGSRAYVYNQFNHQVVRFENRNADGTSGGPRSEVVAVKTVDLGLADTLPPELAIGRRNFFDAQSSVMSASQTHVACSTCHLEGREDGHVWRFPDGARQTPGLVGRGVKETAPYLWKAQFTNFNDFMHETVVKRMGGSGTSDAQNDQMLAWLASEPAPENANLVAGGLTTQQQRGQAAFAKAQCGTCHAGSNFTDSANGVVTLHDVGVGGSFDTPSLKGLARSAPYLHDGSAHTLLDRLQGSDAMHGDLSQLDDQAKLDLVAYLKTL